MPRNRARRKDRNKSWETSEGEEAHGSGSGGHSSGKRVSLDERDDGNVDARDDHQDHTNGLSNGRPLEPRQGIESWAQAVSGTALSLRAAHQALNGLRDALALHMDDLSQMEETQNRVTQLEGERRGIAEEVKRLENTVTTLTSLDQKARAQIESRQAEIEKERQELDQEKSKQEKRVAAVIAEEKLRLKTEHDELVVQQSEAHDKREKELEDSFARRDDESGRRAAALEAARGKLWATAEEQRRTIEVRTVELEKSREQCDVLERAKDSVKKEKRDLETEMEAMKEELGLIPRSIGHFEQRFAAIQRGVEKISLEYFSDTDIKDPETAREALVAADPCFNPVPIDDSDDSRNLRVAHAQRVIAGALCQTIWTPLSCEFTSSRPELADLLCMISDEMGKSRHGGRTANVWTALTMRVLQSLPADWAPGTPRPTKSPSTPVRVGRVVSQVCSVLSPLIAASANASFRAALHELVISAIDVWSDAHSGGLRIIVSPLLQRAHREEWRSSEFDPALPPGARNDTESDESGRTRPRVFTLFPRVTAREVVDAVDHEKSPPGGWPRGLEQAPRMRETCIHPGRGLPEWSPLVVRGKEEQEERDIYVQNALETAKREAHTTRRTSGHGRTGSQGTPAPASLSPTELWSMEGAMKSPQK